MSATWYKLKDDSWGVKIRHDGQPGQEVTVTNKKGEERTVFLGKRVAKFDDAQLWSVSDEAPAASHKTLDEEPF